MTTPMSRVAATAAAAAAAAVAAPAAALAHPSVYTATAPVNCVAPAPPYTLAQVTCDTQTRYVFTNHGNTYLLRESNGRPTRGAISYAHAPAALRNASDWDLFGSAATTGAQTHATCDVPALTSDAVIRSWQGADPFWAYVPFQRTAIGVDDDAADWLGVVQSATGLNLAAIGDTDGAREAACEALPGATASSYAAADATQSSTASWAAGPVAAAVQPLEASIATLTQQLADTSGARAGEAATAKTALDAAQAEIASLKAALRPLRVTLPSPLPSPSALAAGGVALRLAGPAGRTVGTRLRLSAASARRLGLRSQILAARDVTLAADGTASFVLTPAAPVASRLRRARGVHEIAVEARSGDRHNLVSGRIGGS